MVADAARSAVDRDHGLQSLRRAVCHVSAGETAPTGPTKTAPREGALAARPGYLLRAQAQRMPGPLPACPLPTAHGPRTVASRAASAARLSVTAHLAPDPEASQPLAIRDVFCQPSLAGGKACKEFWRCWVCRALGGVGNNDSWRPAHSISPPSRGYTPVTVTVTLHGHQLPNMCRLGADLRRAAHRPGAADARESSLARTGYIHSNVSSQLAGSRLETEITRLPRRPAKRAHGAVLYPYKILDLP